MLNLPSGGGGGGRGGGGGGAQDRADVLGRPDVHALLMQVAAGHTTAPKLMQTVMPVLCSLYGSRLRSAVSVALSRCSLGYVFLYYEIAYDVLK